MSRGSLSTAIASVFVLCPRRFSNKHPVGHKNTSAHATTIDWLVDWCISTAAILDYSFLIVYTLPLIVLPITVHIWCTKIPPVMPRRRCSEPGSVQSPGIIAGKELSESNQKRKNHFRQIRKPFYIFNIQITFLFRKRNVKKNTYDA